MIKINYDLKPVQERLQRMRGRVERLRPFMREVKDIMLDAVEENFAQQGRPKWVPLKPATLAARGGNSRILQRTGRLAASISGRYSDKEAVVGTNVKYAAIHQFGGKTAAHVIRPRHARALFWTGAAHPVARVNHPGSKIPARPFLKLTDSDRAAIVEAAKTFLGD